jgi:hypothetical protein
MVARRKIIVIEDKPKEAMTPGYLPSGESAFSIKAAKGHKVDIVTADRSNRSWSRLDVMVQHERKEVAKLERRAQEARGTEKHAPICVRLQRTRHFLARLEAEQRGLAP